MSLDRKFHTEPPPPAYVPSMVLAQRSTLAEHLRISDGRRVEPIDPARQG